MATRAVCPACGDTREIRADGLSVGCPFHGDTALVQMDSEASAQIRANILDHARANPQETAGDEPPGWQATAADPGKSPRMLGGVVVVIVVMIILTALVVLW